MYNMQKHAEQFAIVYLAYTKVKTDNKQYLIEHGSHIILKACVVKYSGQRVTCM